MVSKIIHRVSYRVSSRVLEGLGFLPVLLLISSSVSLGVVFGFFRVSLGLL